MKTKSFWSFLVEGIQQASLVLAGLVLLGGIGWLLAFSFQKFTWVPDLSGLLMVFCVSVVSGPVPVILACFDITNKELLVGTFVLLVPYWACLGIAAGFWRWVASDPDAQPLIIGFWGWLKGKADSTSSAAASPWKTTRRTRVTVEVLAVVLAVVIFPVGLMNRGSGRGRHITVQINLQLRQLESAKKIFAQEANPPQDHIPTAAELAPYLPDGTNFFLRPAGPVTYVVNATDQRPYAVIHSDWRIPRNRWREGYTLTNGTIIRLP